MLPSQPMLMPFWCIMVISGGGKMPVLTGMKRRRIGKLIQHDISLIAYHLPLDAHPELGNNACLGKATRV